MSDKTEELVIQLFKVGAGGEIEPTIHCYALKFLKVIMDKFPDNYMDVYRFLYYMTCPDPVYNPYFNTNDLIREETIIRDNILDVDTEAPEVIIAIEKCKALYETPTIKAQKAIRGMIENLLEWVEDVKFVSGRDGNVGELLRVAKEFKNIREEYNQTTKDLHEEQKENKIRGDKNLAYDLKKGSTRDDD